MSRSAFAARFHTCVEMAQLDHLTRLWMIRARRALIDSDQPFVTIAVRNHSQTSCSQSFKHAFGYSTKSRSVPMCFGCATRVAPSLI
jgi:transcriptional regulator GlxA family with amidase domain